MRTKALVLTAAISAASLVSALAADPVYSVNVVGYVTKTVNAGFTLIANPLIATNNPNSTIQQLVPVAPAGSQVYKFNGTGYEIATYDDLLEPPGWDVPNITIPAGQGFFISLPPGTSQVITWVGEVAQREFSNKSIPGGFSMTGSLVPAAGGINDIGLPGAAGDQAYKYVPGAGYTVATFDDLLEPPAWDANLVMDVGEGFFVRLAGSLPWNRNFVVQ